jgi:hypothetical protein
MSTHAQHHAHETVVGEFVLAVLQLVLTRLIELATALGLLLARLIVGPKFEAPAAEPAAEEPPVFEDPAECGLNDQYVDTLHGWNAEDTGKQVPALAVARQAVTFHTALGDTYPGLAIDDSEPLLATYDAAALALVGGER